MILLIITNIISIIIIFFQRAKFDRLMDEFLKALEEKERLVKNDR